MGNTFLLAIKGTLINLGIVNILRMRTTVWNPLTVGVIQALGRRLGQKSKDIIFRNGYKINQCPMLICFSVFSIESNAQLPKYCCA